MVAGCLSRARLYRVCLKNPRNNNYINQLNWVSALADRFPFWLYGLLLLTVSSPLVAQIFVATNTKLVYGSVVTGDGKPVAKATVEIRDLYGVLRGNGFSDASGSFEISTKTGPGQYILLASKERQVGEARITLDQQDLGVKIAFPFASESVGSKPPRQTVSVKQLSIRKRVLARLSRAHEEFGQTNLEGALKEIDAALRSDPSCAQAFSMRAFIKLAARDFSGAAEDARHAIVLDPDEAESYLALGTAYKSLQAFAKAEESMGKALNLRPDSWQAQIEMAKSLYGLGQFILALRELEALNRDFPDVHLVRGDVLMRLERRQEAAEEFRVFLKEAPNDPRNEEIQRIVASERRVGDSVIQGQR
jgi:Tfp pilus assembly protein PilF